MTSEYMHLLNSGFGFVLLLLIVIIACAATYIMLQRRLKLEIAAMRAQIERDLEAKATHPNAVPKPDIVTPAKPVIPAKPDTKSAPSPQPQQTAEELAHETLVLIA